jgi:PAS domain S-box-containing protein
MIKRLSFLAARMDAKLTVVLVLAGLLPLLVAGCLGLHFASQTVRQEVMGNLQVVADSKAQRIEDSLLTRVRDVTIQSRSRSVLSLAERLGAAFHGPGIHSPEYVAAAAAAREHFQRYAQPNYYDNVLLIDADGDVVFSLDPAPEMGTNLRAAPAAGTALARVFDLVGMLLSGENSDFELDAASGEQKAFVAAPIFNAGVLRGVVAFRINNREMFEIAGDYTGLGDTGETVICRREGANMLVMTPTRHDPAAAFQRRIAIDSRNGMPMREATRGNSGVGPAWDYRGAEVLAAWKYLPALRYGLVVKMDAAEALAPIRRLREAAIVLGCVVALVLALLAPLVARYLAAPIRHLSQTTRAFSSGDLTHRARIDSTDEIGNFAIVFNQMADIIQQQIATLSRAGHDLELRVEERTAELEKANRALRTEVAEHERAEESRRESEERFSGAFEYAPIGVALVSPDGHWLKVNRAVCELVGYPEEELLSRTFQDITHPDDLEADLENVRRLLAGEISSYQMEKRYLHQRGHLVPALLTVSLVRDAQGRPRYFISQIQDITRRKEAEERLVEEQARLQFMFESMPVGVALARIYPEGRIERIINDAHLRISGLTREEDRIPGIYERITHPEDFARQSELGRDLGEDKAGQYSLEKRYIRPDGSMVWVVYSFQRRIRDDGSFEELTTVVDISELKRAEEGQRETSALLETLLQNATDDIYFKDLESRFVYFSQSMLTHFRRTDPAEIKGHTDFDFFSEEHARPAYEAEQEVIRTGRAMLNLEEKETHIDGGVTWALTSKMPWRDKAGHIIGTMGISKDITERKEIEQALGLTLERLQIAVKAGKAGTWDHDLLTGRVGWDDEMHALYGMPADGAAFGIERWYDALHPEDRASTIALYEAARHGAKPSFDTEFRIHRGDDGSPRFIRAMGVVLRDESGRPVRMTGVNWDVTEERIREKKLAEALAHEKELVEKAQAGSRAKSEFLAVMSHEIRTPMNGILGFSELLAGAPNLPTDCRDYVKTIASSGEALLRIIDDILDFSRLEAGGLKVEPTLLSSREILEDVHTLLAPRAGEKHLEFHLALEDGIPERLWNDPGRLRQILINLVGNALKFTAHGSITLGMRPSRSPLKDGDAGVEIFVRDTGTGIPPDKLDHVFEPFAQADSSISRRYGGTGLGLAISRNLVELMGGALSVRSEVGEGSEFVVTLPIGMPQGTEPLVQGTAGDELDETFAASHPLRILLVEDDQVNRKLLLIMLRKLGYTALTARDGVEAVEIYRRERPDCILMDLQMPRKGGIETTIEIREMENASPGHGRAFISALTANIGAEDRRECFAVGMDAHLNKPIKRALLAKMLEQASEAKFGE